MIKTILIIIALCIVIAIILPSFIVPNLYFIKTEIQKSEKLKKVASKLKSKNKEQTLRNVFNYVKNLYSNERWKVILFFPKIFINDVEKLIDKKQFLHCPVQNLILITLLINTKQFTEKDFEKKLKISDFGVIHQYLLINSKKKKFKVDCFYRIFKEGE